MADTKNPEVWLSERARPTVRMRIAGLDITMERVRGPDSGVGDYPRWQVMQIQFVGGGGIFHMAGGVPMCNHTDLIRAAEEAFEATPDGATQTTKKVRRAERSIR